MSFLLKFTNSTGCFCVSKVLPIQTVFCRHATTLKDKGPPLSENDHITTDVINRNPRNLEEMCVDKKRKGYPLERVKREYWHKLFVEQSSSEIKARIEHCSGTTVLSASSTEWPIRRFLVSTGNISAVHNVARVLAQRCLESGILHIHHAYGEEDLSPKVKLFLQILEENGVVLKEPEAIDPLPAWR